MRTNKKVTLTATVASLALIGGVALAVTASSSEHKTAPVAATAPTGPSPVELGKMGTAPYHNIKTALADGYTELKDAKGIACIDNPGVGGMGIHYVKGVFVEDPTEHEITPEVLVYAPQPNGGLKLVALEYVVLKDAWEKAGNTAVPSLYGQKFELVGAGNRYGLPAFYELHAWVWEHNPRGMFDDWNPNVSCTPKATQKTTSSVWKHAI